MKIRGGALLVFAIGAGATAYSWYLAWDDREVKVWLSLVGPPLALFGICSVVLPPERLMRPYREIRKGDQIVGYGSGKLTLLGILIALLGLALAFLQHHAFKEHWFF
jgi:hypothetical protein